jgi:hypothetical protein
MMIVIGIVVAVVLAVLIAAFRIASKNIMRDPES